MKLRVKLSGAWRSVEIADKDPCTLSQLRQRISHVMELGERSFDLSLNCKDALDGEDQTLSQLGLVSGDILFLLYHNHQMPDYNNADINNSANGRDHATSPSSSSTSCPSSGGQASDTAHLLSTSVASVNASVTASGIDLEDTDADHSGPHTEQTTSGMSCGEGLVETQAAYSGTENHGLTSSWSETENEAYGVRAQPDEHFAHVGEQTSSEFEYEALTDYGGAEDTERLSPSPLEDPEVNRCLQEPLLCRESTSKAVPAVLRDVYTAAGCMTPADALWVIVHTLMMEVGFRPVQQADILLAADWNNQGFYKQEYYHLCVSTQHTYSIVGVVMGPVLIVHGGSKVDPAVKTDRQHLKIAHYVYSTSPGVTSVYRNLERLSRTVKDLICQPLLSHLSEVCGFPVSLGLLSLSYEVKVTLKVLSYLPASSLVVMGQVCREYNATYKDPCLWRRLHLREFGRNGDNSLNKDWYTLYKEEYLLRKERRKMTGRRHPALTGIPPWLTPGHFPPLRPMPYTGGFLGGDYDINPEFTSGIPHPLFNPPTPNPFHPLGPLGHPDPGDPFPPRPRFPDPSAPGSFSGPAFMSQGGSNPRPSPVVSLGGRASHNPRPSPFQSLGGNRFL